MQKELEVRWQRIESLTVGLVERTAALSETARRDRPVPEEWSPLQVIDHVMRAEAVIVGYSRAGPPQGVSSPFQRAVIRLLCAALRSGIRLPAPETMEPASESRSLDVLTDAWTTERSHLKSALENAQAASPFGKHPYFGPVTAAQTLDMIEAHLIYHTKRFPAVK